MNQFRASIVVLCYNGLEETTRPCLESILANTPTGSFELIVVDNASADGTADYLKTFAAGHVNVRIQLNDINKGYAGGNNDGIRLAQGQYIVLLNNDTLVPVGWLDKLLRLFSAQPDVGLVGPVTNSAGNEQRIELEGLGEKNYEEISATYVERQKDVWFTTEKLGFFCVAMRCTLPEKIGYLDEKFGIGMFEDDDYCIRVKKAGFSLAVVEDCFVYHKGSVSFKKLATSDYIDIFNRNREYFFEKHGILWTYADIAFGVWNKIRIDLASAEKSGTRANFERIAGRINNMSNALHQLRDVEQRYVASGSNAIFENQLANNKRQLMEMSDWATNLKHDVERLSQTIAEHDGQIVSLNHVIAERDGQIAGLHQTILQLAKNLAELRQSISWKITRPLRFLRSLINNPKKAMYEAVRFAFLHLPLTVRQALKGPRHKTVRWFNSSRNLRDGFWTSHVLGQSERNQHLNLSSDENGPFIAPDTWFADGGQYAVLVLPNNEWDSRVQRTQQLAITFAAKGHPVLFASQQFGDSFVLEHLASGVTRIKLPGSDGIDVRQQMVVNAQVAKMADAIAAYIENIHIRHLVCVTQLPFWEPLAKQLRVRTGCKVVYDCADDQAGFHESNDTSSLAENGFFEEADLVLASSQSLYEKAALSAGKPVVSVTLPDLMPFAEAGHITFADTAETFAKAIETEIQNNTPERQDARRDCAMDGAVRELYPLASIIIVTYNNLALNRLCLDSVLKDTAYPNIEIVVVDNASSDDTPSFLRALEEKESRIVCVFNQTNRGFAAANNQGLALARGQYLCCMNNDTVVSGNWLSTLLDYLQRHPDLGLVGPVTNAIGNEAQIRVGYKHLADMPSWSAEYCASQRGKLVDIPMLAFFCVAMRRETLECVGMLDEAFGTGMFEDDDYCRRVREAGFTVKLAKDAFIHHWQRASFKLLGEDEYLRIYYENQGKYKAKWAAHNLEKQSHSLANLLDSATNSLGVVVFPPSIGWDVHLFQRPHHLARALAQLGYVVVFDCSGSHESLGLLKEIEARLFLFQGEPRLLRDIKDPIIWTFTYNYDYVNNFITKKIIYDWIDDLSVFPYDQKWLRGLHERALLEADVVASVANILHENALKVRPDAIYLPNAVELNRFDKKLAPNPAFMDLDIVEIVSSGKPLAGYYGALAEWFDYDLIIQVAVIRPDWNFLLIGPDLDQSIGRSRISHCKNVFWIGPRDYEILPNYLQLFDVATIPFKINKITLATSPLKLYEYFAGKKPVLTTALPECKLYPEVRIANSPKEFALMLDEVKDSGFNEVFRNRLSTLALENDWGARVNAAISALAKKTELAQ